MTNTRRTRGDGKEEEKVVAERSSPKITPKQLDVLPTQKDSLPKGRIYNLVPRLVPSTVSVHNTSFPKTREPKFVPFEPYPACTAPMFPNPSNRHLKYRSTSTKRSTNIDLNTLVHQIAKNTETELGFEDGSASEKSLLRTITADREFEKKYIEMKKEKDYFEKQLKFQTQVNSELKHLLIAAVGEDLQTRVNVLTEDKLTLARALLDSSNHLSSHSEQIEYLAGQSEVWRSKFLASSLMVEELARWKTSLMEKNRALITSSKEMLKTVTVVREMEIEILKNLSFLIRRPSKLPSSNCMDLASECLNISQQLTLINNSLGMPENIHLDHLDNLTDAERMMKQALAMREQNNLIASDDPFKAIVGHAFPSMVALKEQREQSLDNPGCQSSDA